VVTTSETTDAALEAEPTQALVSYEQARQAISLVRQLPKAKLYVDQLSALQDFARRAKDHELQCWVSEMRLRAERRTGELLRDNVRPGNPQWLPPGTIATTLDKLKISKRESMEWQRLASLSGEEFDEYLARAQDADPARITTRKILRDAGLLDPSEPDDEVEAEATPESDDGDRQRFPAWFGTIQNDGARILKIVEQRDWSMILPIDIAATADRYEHIAVAIRAKARNARPA
jgi:hypothetical protein